LDLPMPAPSPTYTYTFFPPEPPIYGGKISESAGFNGISIYGRILEQLPEWVGEPFYPPLGTRLHQGELAKGVAAHLASYRAQRDRLRNDLLDQLTVGSNLVPAAQAAALRAFARAQTPTIAALETDAEKLRDELVRGTWTKDGADWNGQRGWFLGRTGSRSGVPPGYADNAEFQVTRAAAFFQPGLGAAQRGMVYELAIEEHEKILATGPSPRIQTAAGDPTVIFFSPEAARFRLPATLPAELRAKFGQFVHDKDALKRELRETLVAQDGASDSKRRAVFQKLTEQQWPRVVALDELAESIRADLATLPAPPPLPPQFPADLVARINANRDALAALWRERLAVKPTFPAATPVPSPPNDSHETSPAETRASRRAEFLPDETDPDLRRQTAARSAALIAERSALLAEFRAAYERIATSNAAFAQFSREEVIFRDYRAAMLTPGLSPEQRRLLFTYALAGLAQALPMGESPPSARFTPAP
jgi:hypothetical protein